jgi:dTDP-4-dehydrorhamnose reductase
VAITGANGQLGTALQKRLGARALPWTLEQCELSAAESIRDAIETPRPEVVINCAAHTAVDVAEDDADACHRINAGAVNAIAKSCNTVGALLVQVSTDYVFRGATPDSGPNDERSHTHGVYADSKLAGESMAAQSARHLIVRTCGIYGHLPQPKNFFETMLCLGATRDELTVVNDQHCKPTSAHTVADAIIVLIDGGHEGVFYVAAGPPITWYGFAREIFAYANMTTKVTPITTEQFRSKANRPRFSVLDTNKYTGATGRILPSIDEDLAANMARRS